MNVNVAVNPVLRRELVERMRGRGAFVLLTVYLTILSLILYVTYQSGKNDSSLLGSRFDDGFGSAVDPTQIASVGRGIFEWLLFFMMIVVLFMVPGQVSGAIAGERERQTLVPLQVTLLRPRSILLGKIGAALAFLMLLMVATVPLLAVTYLIGGVTVGDVLGGVARVVFVGLVLGCGCAAISAFVRRVQLATVLGYGLALALLLGTVLVQLAVNVIDESRGSDEGSAPAWILLPNPFATVASGVADGPNEAGSTSTAFDWFEQLFVAGDDDCQSFFVDELGQEFCDETGEPLTEEGSQFPAGFWWQSLLVLTVGAVGAVVLGSRRLRTPAAVER